MKIILTFKQNLISEEKIPKTTIYLLEFDRTEISQIIELTSTQSLYKYAYQFDITRSERNKMQIHVFY